eukprot:tig00020912_g15795.t1
MASKGDTTDQPRLGIFKEQGYLSSGDPATKTVAAEHLKSILTNPQRLGQTGDNWGGKSRDVRSLYVGSPYIDPAALERQEKEKQKNWTKAFVPPKPPEKNSGSGGYWGTFGPKLPHLPDEDLKPRSASPPQLLKPILVPVGKKGGFGYPNTTIGKSPEYMNDPYDGARKAEKEEKERMRALRQGRPNFKTMVHQKDFFDSQEHVAASKLLGHDGALPPAKPEPPRPERPAKPFKPCGGVKQGQEGFFYKIEYVPDPEQERKKLEAEAREKGRPAHGSWRPNSGPFTVRQPSVALHPSNLYTQDIEKATALF